MEDKITQFDPDKSPVYNKALRLDLLKKYFNGTITKEQICGWYNLSKKTFIKFEKEYLKYFDTNDPVKIDAKKSNAALIKKANQTDIEMLADRFDASGLIIRDDNFLRISIKLNEQIAEYTRSIFGGVVKTCENGLAEWMTFDKNAQNIIILISPFVDVESAVGSAL